MTLDLTVDDKVKVPPSKYDPAMILTMGNNRFLVCTWDVDGEEPFEKYLNEFTANFVKKAV